MPKLLLVEDNEMNRDMLSRRLARKGYDVLLAVDGNEGLQKARTDAPDLILFTGDFVDCKKDHRPALPLVERLVTGLRPKVGLYAVVGNHDGDGDVERQHHQPVKPRGQQILDRMMAHRSGDIDIGIGVMQRVQAPQPRHCVLTAMCGVMQEIE